MERIREEEVAVGSSAAAAKKRKVGSIGIGIQCCHRCDGRVKCEGCGRIFENEDDNDGTGGLEPPPAPDPRRYWALWAKGYYDKGDVDVCFRSKRLLVHDKPIGQDANAGGDESKLDDNASVSVVAGSTDGRKNDNGDNDDKTSRREAVARSGQFGSSGNFEVGDAAGAAYAAERHHSRILRTWEGEMELAHHCKRVRDKIEKCRQKILRHEQIIEDCRQEATNLERELHDWIALPRLFVPELAAYSARCLTSNGGGDDDDDEEERVAALVYDERIVPRRLRGYRDFAWSLLNSDNPLPVPFQQMLWMDPTCPLRADRDILMASIDKGLNRGRVTIVWSQDMANDKQLVRKCFEMCPHCLESSGDDDDVDDDGGLPTSHLDDMDNLRAFAFSDHDNARACRKWGRIEDSKIYGAFSKALFQDPALMADLVLQSLRVNADDRRDSWVYSAVDGAFPLFPKREDRPTPQPLLDSAEFALRVARGLLGVPDLQRHACPVTYRRLSPRLRASPEVAMAFVRLHPPNLLFVPPELRNNANVWCELWEVATTGNSSSSSSTGTGVPATSSDAPSIAKRLATEGLALRLLDEAKSKREIVEALDDFAEVFPSLDTEIQLDRDVNLQMAVACAYSPSTELWARLAPEWIQSREFWIDLAEKHHCKSKPWTHAPAPETVAADPAVVLAWVRHARPCFIDSTRDPRWVADAVAKFPCLALLADRQVLLNWMPHLFSSWHRDHDETKRRLLEGIPQLVLEDKSLWLELLLSVGDENDPRFHIPASLRHDPDIVDAQLRYPVTKREMFRGCYSTLPLELRHRFAHRLVAAIEGSEDLRFDHGVDMLLAPDLLRIPEVALAALAKGWDPDSKEKVDAIRESSWTNDPAVLLSLAGRRSTGWGETFWKCCSDDLRRNKAFLLDVLKLEDPPPLFVEGGLKRDYDILCATFVHRDPPGRLPTRFDSDFIRTARERLQQYLSLEAFMTGIQSLKSCRPRQGPSPPVALLRQGGDTLEGLKRRMVELLGCPSHEEASVLRRVSLTFIMHGV
jgi:hypothetical protein